MATRAALVDMEDAASKRIKAATALLTERYGITPVAVPFERSSDLRHIRMLEAQAALLEQVVTATEPKAAPRAEAKPPAKAKDA